MKTKLSAASPGAASTRFPWRSFRLIWVVGTVGVVVSGCLAAWFAYEARRVDEARFFQLCNAVGGDLERRVEAIEGMLRDLERVLNAQEAPDLVDWDEFVNQVAPEWNFPGVLALGYATNVNAADTWRTLENWSRAESPRTRDAFYLLPDELGGARSWRVWVLDCYREDLRPPGAYGSVHAVTNSGSGKVQRRRFSEAATPLETRANPFSRVRLEGRDLFLVDESDKAFLENAIYRDDVKISGCQPLTQPPADRCLPGATMVVPTYHPRRTDFWRALPPEESRRYEPFWLRWQLNAGFVFAWLDFAALLDKAQGVGERPLRLEIHSAQSQDASVATWLNPDGQGVRAGDASFRPAFRLAYRWPMYGDRWTLFFHTTPLFDAESTRFRAWWAGGWGLLTTGLVCWILALQVRARLREAQRATQLHEARDALLAVQQQREHLSHDLHDGAIQSLYAIQLGLTQTASEVQAVSPDASRRLAESRANLDAVIGELRDFLGQLIAAESPRHHAGLAAVLAATVQRLRPASTAAIELECDEALAARFSPDQALQLAAFFREALSNSLRHARASRITVRLVACGGDTVLEVNDDGSGFDSAIVSGKGLGLASLRRRAAALGGEMTIQSARGAGTQVRVRLKSPPEQSAVNVNSSTISD